MIGIIAVIALVAIAGIGFYYIRRSSNLSVIQTQQQATSTTVQTPSAASTSANIQNSSSSTEQTQTFSSPSFGITFKYFPQTMVVENDGNIVYVDFLQSHQPREGDSMQVFKKNPSDSLSAAIKNVVFSGQLPSLCSISLNTHDNVYIAGGNTVTASISDSNYHYGSSISTCTKYADGGSPRSSSFFLEETTHPELFYFITTGSAFGAHTNTIDWIYTLKVLSEIPGPKYSNVSISGD